MREGLWAAALAALLLLPTAAAELGDGEGSPSPSADEAPVAANGPGAPQPDSPEPPATHEPDEEPPADDEPPAGEPEPEDDPPSQSPSDPPTSWLGSLTAPAPPTVGWNVGRGEATVRVGNVTISTTTVTDPAREAAAPVRDLAVEAANEAAGTGGRTVEFLLQSLLCRDGSRECPDEGRWLRSEACRAQAWVDSRLPEAVPDGGLNQTFHQWIDCTFDAPAAPPDAPPEEDPQSGDPVPPEGWQPEHDGPIPVAPPAPCLADKLDARSLDVRVPVLERVGDHAPQTEPVTVPGAPGVSCAIPEKVDDAGPEGPLAQGARPPGGSVLLAYLLKEGTPLLAAAGLIAASAAAFAALAARGTPLPAVLVAGYAKLSRRRVEEHPTRDALLALLRASPGLHMEELRRRLDVPLSTLRHHLNVLARHGLVALSQAGSRTFAVPSEADERGFGLRCRALGSATARRLLDLVRLEPGLNQSTLAARLAKARSTVRWHLESLERAGLVSARRADGEAAYFGV